MSVSTVRGFVYQCGSRTPLGSGHHTSPQVDSVFFTGHAAKREDIVTSGRTFTGSYLNECHVSMPLAGTDSVSGIRSRDCCGTVFRPLASETDRAISSRGGAGSEDSFKADMNPILTDAVEIRCSCSLTTTSAGGPFALQPPPPLQESSSMMVNSTASDHGCSVHSTPSPRSLENNADEERAPYTHRNARFLISPVPSPKRQTAIPCAQMDTHAHSDAATLWQEILVLQSPSHLILLPPPPIPQRTGNFPGTDGAMLCNGSCSPSTPSNLHTPKQKGVCLELSLPTDNRLDPASPPFNDQSASDVSPLPRCFTEYDVVAFHTSSRCPDDAGFTTNIAVASPPNSGKCSLDVSQLSTNVMIAGHEEMPRLNDVHHSASCSQELPSLSQLSLHLTEHVVPLLTEDCVETDTSLALPMPPMRSALRGGVDDYVLHLQSTERLSRCTGGVETMACNKKHEPAEGLSERAASDSSNASVSQQLCAHGSVHIPDGMPSQSLMAVPSLLGQATYSHDSVLGGTADSVLEVSDSISCEPCSVSTPSGLAFEGPSTCHISLPLSDSVQYSEYPLPASLAGSVGPSPSKVCLSGDRTCLFTRRSRGNDDTVGLGCSTTCVSRSMPSFASAGGLHTAESVHAEVSKVVEEVDYFETVVLPHCVMEHSEPATRDIKPSYTELQSAAREAAERMEERARLALRPLARSGSPPVSRIMREKPIDCFLPQTKPYINCASMACHGSHMPYSSLYRSIMKNWMLPLDTFV